MSGDMDEIKASLVAAFSEALEAQRGDQEWEESREVIVEAGHRLYEIGGERLMLDTLYDVAGIWDDPEHGRILSIVDHRWTGIGNWVA